MGYYEAALIDSTDDIQFKVYSSAHPDGFVIAKPKYIPVDLLDFKGLKKRFLFSKCVTRFNLFNKKEIVEHNLEVLKSKFPEYIYECKKHNNWFLGVPESKIKKFYDTKKGFQELLRVPEDDLDPYLKAVMTLSKIMNDAGISNDEIGISHSTLLGNYTPGTSDIDMLLFGIDNGWKAVKHLETCEHEMLTWKKDEDWARYFRDRVVSEIYTEEEYVKNMVRKRDDGYIDKNVFSLFCIPNEDENWYDWDAQHESLGTVILTATVKDARYSIVRPGYYELEDSKIVEGHDEVPIKRIVTWARPYALQAKEGEQVEACGLLEKVTSNGEEYYQVVIGYFDTYTSDRGKKEYMKALI